MRPARASTQYFPGFPSGPGVTYEERKCTAAILQTKVVRAGPSDQQDRTSRMRAFIVPHSTAISKGIGIYGVTRYHMVGACFVEHPWTQKRQRQEKRRRLDCGQETSGTYLSYLRRHFLLDAARNQPAVSQCQQGERGDRYQRHTPQ